MLVTDKQLSCLFCLFELSLRAQYGISTLQNALHASDSSEMAARELGFFFPKFDVPLVPGSEPPLQRTVALIRPDALREHKGEV